jgi:hypothetical protein
MKVLKMGDTKRTLSYTNAAFKALNDALIPGFQYSAQNQSPPFSASLEHRIDEYQIWALNHSLSQTMFGKVFHIHLAEPTAKILNKAARQLINNAGNKEPVNPVILRDTGAFAALAPNDRLRAISFLEQLKVNPLGLPFPFFYSPSLVLSIIGTVIMLTTIGYYSGWTGYGSTSLEVPENRSIESFPASWQQAGYPGPSKGYHAFRGYLIDKFTE